MCIYTHMRTRTHTHARTHARTRAHTQARTQARTQAGTVCLRKWNVHSNNLCASFSKAGTSSSGGLSGGVPATNCHAKWPEQAFLDRAPVSPLPCQTVVKSSGCTIQGMRQVATTMGSIVEERRTLRQTMNAATLNPNVH